MPLDADTETALPLSAACYDRRVPPESIRDAYHAGQIELIRVETGLRPTYLVRPSELDRYLSTRRAAKRPSAPPIAKRSSARPSARFVPPPAAEERTTA
jgi:hypothetical protein